VNKVTYDQRTKRTDFKSGYLFIIGVAILLKLMGSNINYSLAAISLTSIFLWIKQDNRKSNMRYQKIEVSDVSKKEYDTNVKKS